MTDELKPLSRKHQKFVNEYLKRWNGTRAYMAVYPKAAEDSARTSAAELLAKDNISAAIAERIKESQMSADEALEILAAHARGDMGQFSDRLGGLDFQSAKEAGLSRLIKKFKQRTVTKIGKTDKDEDIEIHDVEIELYDAQAAAEKILKVHGKFTERVDLTSGGDKIAQIGINTVDYRANLTKTEE
jgi:phage terminase small subunit